MNFLEYLENLLKVRKIVRLGESESNKNTHTHTLMESWDSGDVKCNTQHPLISQKI